LNVSNPNDNYVFMPANVSILWNNQTVVHYSAGAGLPLGVVSTKVFTPNQGFQGSNVTVAIGITNQGTLPIYQVTLNNSFDPFLQIFRSSNSSSQPVLGAGQKLNAIVNASLSGSPGVYDSSTSSASFIFAGTNQTAPSSTVKITIFHLPEANITYSAAKLEEGHDIQITVTLTNPANVTISNIAYTLNLPKGLSIARGESASFTIPSLAPNANFTHAFTVTTSQPYGYSLGNAKLTFEYQGHEISGIAGSMGLSIGDDISLRYAIPIVIGLAIVVGTLFYVRKLTKNP
ncbi:MAG: hypothetical protein ACREBS_04115, partial [Nitrososphaerales archaeon]